MTNVFISTGGIRKNNAYETCLELNKLGLKNFELSGGKYFKNVKNLLLELEKKGLRIQLHNYFPVPEKPFVLNLASLDKLISKLSLEHCKKSIDIASKLSLKRYSVHAGFCIDPSTKDLGKPFKRELCSQNREYYYKNFVRRVKEIKQYADSRNVELYIENNVSIKENIYHGKSLLLCSNSDEIIRLISDTGVKFLLDTGHLIVSARSLNLNEDEEFKTLKNITNAYHLSSNNRIRDQNKSIKGDKKILEKIKKNADFYTLEIYMAKKNILEDHEYLINWLNER